MNCTEDQIRDRKVLIESWKSIKKITTKTTYGGRTYSDNTPTFSREMKQLCNSVVKLDADSTYDNFKIDPWMVEAIVCDDTQLEEPSKYEIEYEAGSTNLIGSYRTRQVNSGTDEDLLNTGRYRITEKFTNEHSKTQNEMMRLGALIEAVTIEMNMEDWVADWNDDNQSKYYIDCDCKGNRYYSDCWWTLKTTGVIYVPKKVSERVCEILNNKEYEL
jgi:hypothetical protein